ncbi:hypothetical protein [Nostoc sp. FACHB-280]|uniref:hypothetical protein n=1 Tax=Nostocaceae TaxID=1162 RepID=UPI001F54D332|nr:hypothetical protein [Nostoc sp. FACHB-280]
MMYTLGGQYATPQEFHDDNLYLIITKSAVFGNQRSNYIIFNRFESEILRHNEMTIEMGILQINTGNYEVIPVATREIFYQFWLPACKSLGLQLISHFHDGYLNVVSAEDVPKIVEELICLHSYTLEQEDLAFMSERIERIIHVFQTTDTTSYKYDFG